MEVYAIAWWEGASKNNTSLYRRLFRHVNPGLQLFFTSKDFLNGNTAVLADVSPLTRDVVCYDRVYLGLPVDGRDVMHYSQDQDAQMKERWALFRQTMLRTCKHIEKRRLPSILVVSRKPGGIDAWGNRVFSRAFMSSLALALEKMKVSSKIETFTVSELRGSLVRQACFFAGFDIVLAIHGNALGWIPLLQRESFLVELCDKTVVDQRQYYGYLARSAGINRVNLAVTDKTSPDPAFVERNLEHVLRLWSQQARNVDQILVGP